MSEKNIYQRVNAIMKDCEYLQKEQAQMGKGIKYDTVIAMLRPLLIKHGVVMVVNQLKMISLGAVEGTKQKVYEGDYSLELVNMDKPDEKITHTTSAHGMDGGDKAPGKAQTYAVKIMLTKGFALETGEDEESRAEKMDTKNVISSEQYSELEAFLIEEKDNKKVWNSTHRKVLNAYKIGDIRNLPASKFDEVLGRLKNANN